MLTREEILVIYEAGSEAVIFAIQRLEAIIEEQAIRIAELEERVKVLESRLNQNSRNSSRPPSTDFLSKRNPIPRVSAKRMVENLEVKKVIKGQLLK